MDSRDCGTGKVCSYAEMFNFVWKKENESQHLITVLDILFKSIEETFSQIYFSNVALLTYRPITALLLISAGYNRFNDFHYG